MFEVLDFSDVERVIAGRVCGGDAGNEVGNGAINDGQTGTIDERNLKILLGPAGKVRAQCFLVFSKDADAEASCDRQNLVHIRTVVEGHQY